MKFYFSLHVRLRCPVFTPLHRDRSEMWSKVELTVCKSIILLLAVVNKGQILQQSFWDSILTEFNVIHKFHFNCETIMAKIQTCKIIVL